MFGLVVAALLLSLCTLAVAQSAAACTALKHTLSLENTTITDSSHISANSLVLTPGSCQSIAFVTVALCRIQGVVHTTATSAVHFEAWLPDQWFGRFLGLGNGGLGGCIDYLDLDYGSTLHFATIGTDNGHDGDKGDVFLNNPEVINDFSFRAVHVEAVLGKQIVEAYYGRPHTKSYYLGCSQGGRQGIQTALRFPDDFDGIVAGAPATDFNNIMGAGAMLGRYVGAPNPGSSDAFIPAILWPTITAEILKQCDHLDGKVDKIINNPDLCAFDPGALLCTGLPFNCLTAPQVAALRKVYQPILGTHGQLLFPRYDPGAEGDGQFSNMFSGNIWSIASDWFKFAIFNDSSYSFANFSVSDIEFANTLNPGGIATWDGDLSAFRNSGGKLLTFHGRSDQLIASDNSPRLYDLISSTLSLPTLDDFYRLFLVPGMEHCAGGPGAWAFGQVSTLSNAVNDTTHNILLALVDWVENAHAPDVIIGSDFGGGTHQPHCRYPHSGSFQGDNFVCPPG